MTELQQSRYDALLRRVGDLKGAGSKVNDVLEELFPTLDVETNKAELQSLTRTALGFGSVNLAGTVTLAPKAQIFNPAGSGKILVVTQAIISADADQIMRWGMNNSALSGGSGAEVFRDTRLGLTSRPTGQVRFEQSAALAQGTGSMLVLASSPLKLSDENGIAVCSPGFGFEVGNTNLNTRINVTFYWRERVAEPSELNF